VDVWLDGKDVYWCEGRPKENGRYVVVHRHADGTTVDLTPPGFNARTRVHEYGGGAVLIRDGVVYFSNFDDQKLYRLQVGTAVPQPIGQSVGCRYADANFDAARNRIVCVREDHSGSGEAVNTIVALAADGSRHETVLVSGNDFYSNPRLSPNGRWLAWLTWNHPHMPWISTELWVAKLDDAGAVVEAPRRVGDLETLARDTHKFESRYLDWLVGKYPEEKATYVERSPIHFTDRLTVPVILFQGEEDKVVPPN
jgi:dipeptidyl aminopeptidase/acylaminoacyl peptidase